MALKVLNTERYDVTVASTSHEGGARRQHDGPQARGGGRHGAAEGLVVGVGDDVQGAAVGLLAGRLDLVLGELEAERAVVPQLEGVGEGDAFQTSPVSGRTGVGVCRKKEAQTSPRSSRDQI